MSLKFAEKTFVMATVLIMFVPVSFFSFIGFLAGMSSDSGAVTLFSYWELLLSRF